MTGKDEKKQVTRISLDKGRSEKLGEALDALRKRAQLSMGQLAKEMGYRGQSSIQRYLDHEYDLDLRPTVAARFQKALVGRGTPPITIEEFVRSAVSRLSFEKQQQRMRALLDYSSGETGEGFNSSFPLSNGTARLSLPPRLHDRDIAVLRLWFETILVAVECRFGPEETE